MLSGLETPQDIRIDSWSLNYQPHFLGLEQADLLLHCLQQRSDWTQPEVHIGGQSCRVPRLVSWDGDPGVYYGYSGLVHQTQGWQPELQTLRERIHEATGIRFNFALLNLYRDGQDSIGWHTDKELELGANPIVASVSLGVERDFLLRGSRGGKAFSLPLAHGSLLLMPGRIPHHVPRRANIQTVRINISFRQVVQRADQNVNH